MEQKFLKDTSSTMDRPSGGNNHWPILKIVGIYALCGTLWIYLSDTIIGGLTRNPVLLTHIAVLKGIMYIALTSLLLYALITRHIRRIKEAEESVQRNEEAYRSLFDNMQEGYAYCKMIYDKNNRPIDYIYINVNNAFENLTGLKNVTGKNVSEIIPGIKESSPELLEKYGGTALTGKPEKFEIYLDPLKTWFSISVFSPEKEYFISVFDVITERRRTEEAIKEAELKFRTIFESASEGILLARANGRTFSTANNRICKMLGYTEEELLKLGVSDIHPKESLPYVIDQFEKLLRKEISIGFDIPVMKKDRTVFFADVSGSPLTIAGNEYLLGMFRDITERKQAEEALRETRDYLENLLSFANAPIMVWNPDFMITRFNIAIERVSGFTMNEVVGKHLEILFPVENRKTCLSLVTPISGGSSQKTVEIPILCKNGSIRTVLWSSANIYTADGQTIIATIAQGQDITEQKKFQSQFLQAQKNQSIGTLAGGIAHDFNNILAIILAYTSVLEKSAEDNEKISEYSRIIGQVINRGAALVRQILTFARKTDMALAPMSFGDLIHEILTMLNQTFPKTITFKEIVDKDLPFINADRTQIHQVMMNLCVNARDAMPNGGSITIKAELLSKDKVKEKFSDADQDSYFCISVTDTGEGMNEATRRQIFDPFFTTKEQGKGTGLGLAVVYGVVQSHHGFIDVESRVGRGTTFRLYFPALLENGQSIDVPVVMESFSAGGTETILLVEDEELLVEMIRLMLESKGYRVFTANNGKEAIKLYKLRKKEIDVVLTDLGLPEMTGIYVYKKLKEINPNVIVICASGFFEPDVKHELSQAGVNGFVQKPYTSDDVLRKLREVLDAKNI
jgi:PAS domain S-box-containing protein